MASLGIFGIVMGLAVGAIPGSPQTAGNHTTAGTYHGIYREAGGYHHAWTEQ